MIKLLRHILEKQDEFVRSSPKLKKLAPLSDAVFDFFFGTPETTAFAPHIVDRLDIKRLMTCVVIALGPCALAGIYFYGLRVIAVIAVSYIFGGLTEVIFSIVRRKPVYEGFLVTGLIFPLILPPSIPLWMVAVGSVFGVFFGKEVFGGTGRNIFNPALVGRVFLSAAFPEYFTTGWQTPFTSGFGGLVHYTTDAITSATPLITFKTSQVLTDMWPLIFGAAPGSIGETLRIAVVAGGLFLIVARIADWRIPLSYILSAAAFSFAMNLVAPDKFAPVEFQLLTGGLLFGAFFMATDPVTAPMTSAAKWIYGIMLGIITILIRALSGFVEGVMFAILIMNAFSPLLDSIALNWRYKRVDTEA